MAKQRRGDDVPVEQAPVAQETPAEGFPVPTDATPEAGPAEATDVEADDPTTEDGGSVAEAETQVNPFDVKREFRKHAHTGEVVAVELVGGQLQGARLCSRPEEQTAGALPVMLLEHRESDVAVWYRKNAMDFRPWEPPQPPKMLMDRLRSLYEQAVEARSAYEKAKSAAKFAKDRVEEVDEAIFHALRRMHDVPDGQVELPLAGDVLDQAEATAGDSSVETPEPELPLDVEDQYREANIKDNTGIDV
ncbi:MAG TPA: hypothetical protein VGK73_32185 [Polyangiaceae bacterium]